MKKIETSRTDTKYLTINDTKRFLKLPLHLPRGLEYKFMGLAKLHWDLL